MCSNAASWSILSAVFLLVKPRRASLSPIQCQGRTWTWLRYDESGQETPRMKKYDHKAFTDRHLWHKCSTECYSNPGELICKTIEHVIRTLLSNGQGVQTRGTQLERPPISIVWPWSRTKGNEDRKQWIAAWRITRLVSSQWTRALLAACIYLSVNNNAHDMIVRLDKSYLQQLGFEINQLKSNK